MKIIAREIIPGSFLYKTLMLKAHVSSKEAQKMFNKTQVKFGTSELMLNKLIYHLAKLP